MNLKLSEQDNNKQSKKKRYTAKRASVEKALYMKISDDMDKRMRQLGFDTVASAFRTCASIGLEILEEEFAKLDSEAVKQASLELATETDELHENNRKKSDQ